MISVVLPTYNGISYIKNSVTSILEQTYTDLELIIVDDCSTDGTGDVVDALAKSDDRIHVIHNSVNKKLPASLNIGFENAKGNYYTWTSDDNLYKHDALEVMLNHLKESPNTDIVYAMYDTIDSDGNIITNDNNDSQSCPEENGILHNWVGACFLYKREVHDRLYGYDENLFLVEDFDFWLHIKELIRIYINTGFIRTLLQVREIQISWQRPLLSCSVRLRKDMCHPTNWHLYINIL